MAVALKGSVKVDEFGFEDIDDFWAKAELLTSSSTADVETAVHDTDTYSISEEEEDLEEEETLPLEDSLQSSHKTPRSSLSTIQHENGSHSFITERSLQNTDISLKSSKRKTSALHSLLEGSLDDNQRLVSAPLTVQSTYDDETLQQDTPTPIPIEISLLPSRKKSSGRMNESRRVSFGEGTKESGSKKRLLKGVPKKQKTKKSMTPKSYASLMKTPNSNEFTRGHRISDESFVHSATTDHDDTDGEPDESGFTETSYLDAIRQKDVHLDDEDAGRRSSRVTKGRRFAFWKNERPVYEGGQLVGILAAEPTPRRRPNGKRRRPYRELDSDEDHSDEHMEINKIKRNRRLQLPSDVVFLPREKGAILSSWDENAEEPRDKEVVCLRETLMPQPLPVLGIRKPGKEALVGLAAQSFSTAESSSPPMSGWISGHIDLPPGAIKGE